jgi:regulatory protein
MMRKSRFGSKVGGEKSRDEDRNPDGSGSDAGESGVDAGSGDRYERSSERASASKGTRGWGRKSERAGAERTASARRVWGGASGSGVSRDEAPTNPPASTPPERDNPASEACGAERLERARALLAQTLENPGAAKASHPAQPTPRMEYRAPPDPFEDADPFEPFEQCLPDSTPSAPHVEPAFSESVYSRSTQSRGKASEENAKASKRPQRSLKGRALGYLSRREYSRAELSRKLLPFVEEADSLEMLLDALEREGWLSNERFVESIVHRRAGRMGASRIVHELKRHDVGDALLRQTGDKLSQTELARAHAVWSRKFGTPPATSAERAKQARFLAARGFSGGTIAKVLKGDDDRTTDPPDD